jgi:hypothetical protein
MNLKKNNNHKITMNINTNTILTKHASQSLYKENSNNGGNLPQPQTPSKVKK